MRYMMKQELFSWGKDFYIQDDTGQNRFFVDGKVFSLGNQFSVQDLSGQELCSIQQEVFSWGPTYQIFHRGQLWATVKKELFTFFNCRFDIDEPGAAAMEAEGDFTDHNYIFTRGGKPVAEVSMKFFALSDTYGVDIVDGEEDVLILASTVVIDMACHQRN
ncbi:MAG: LURP-one-related family protein [Acidobacteriia bacterium]|nr:LURP-one-related family protein [Terriglobia bacterium]